jgi:c-di-GMP-binding flagellar brake protein YcgR
MNPEKSKAIGSLKEKRKHVRVEIMGEVKFATTTEPVIKDSGLIYDISIGGASILIEPELKQGSVINLEFDFVDGKGSFAVSGLMVWQDKFVLSRGKFMSGWHRTGVIFNTMSKEQVQRVFRFLYNHVNKSRV